MDVSEDGEASIFGDAAEDARALREAGAAKAFDAGAVGLVVAGFEDEGNGEIGGDALDGVGHGARMGFGLDDAGAGDEEKPTCAHLHGPDFERRTHEGDSIVSCRGSAPAVRALTSAASAHRIGAGQTTIAHD